MITSANATMMDHDFYVTDASDVGIKNWPRSIQTDLGNGRPFEFSSFVVHDNENVAANYSQPDSSLLLQVFND